MTIHTMTETAIHEGTHEYTCPVCGRVVLIEYHPWHREVVKTGDESVAHTGFTDQA